MKTLAFSLALAFASGTAGRAWAVDCTVATKGDSPVAKACKEGGRDAAKKLMKEMQKKAKDKGVAFKCDHCHKDMEKYDLKDKVQDDFKKLIEASK